VLPTQTNLHTPNERPITQKRVERVATTIAIDGRKKAWSLPGRKRVSRGRSRCSPRHCVGRETTMDTQVPPTRGVNSPDSISVSLSGYHLPASRPARLMNLPLVVSTFSPQRRRQGGTHELWTYFPGNYHHGEKTSHTCRTLKPPPVVTYSQPPRAWHDGGRGEDSEGYIPIFNHTRRKTE